MSGVGVSAGWLVAGLGNPGPKYAGTRHDLGFMVVDRLAASAGRTFAGDRDCQAAGPLRLGGDELALLVKPMSYMNRSGLPLRLLLAREGLDPSRMLVVCDDIHLPLGRLRYRP